MANHPIFAPTFHGDVATVKKLLGDDATLISIRDAKNLTPLCMLPRVAVNPPLYNYCSIMELTRTAPAMTTSGRPLSLLPIVVTQMWPEC